MSRATLLLCSLTVGIALLPRSANADPLDPTQFFARGDLTAGGVYNSGVLNTQNGIFYGVSYQGLEVFDFNSINLGAGSVISVASGYSGPPIVLLSRGNVVINGTIDVSASGQNSGPGGGSGAGNIGAGGVGNGAVNHGAILGITGGGGGGFGGPGQDGAGIRFSNFYLPGGSGGIAYGDITKQLVGGSTGGETPNTERAGGGGGGAIEIGAVGSITVNGSIIANGGTLPPFSNLFKYAGGSGGAILLHASSIAINGTLSALGGAGGTDGQGNGGGGRIAVLYSGSYSQNGSVNVGNGQFLLAAAIPEPSPLWLGSVVSLVGLTANRYVSRRSGS